jgi:hypothetical protein
MLFAPNGADWTERILRRDAHLASLAYPSAIIEAELALQRCAQARRRRVGFVDVRI